MTPDLLPLRFAAKVRVDEQGCWIWVGTRNSNGYGVLYVASKQKLAHRFVYEELVEPIEAGLTIDHLCFVKSCVNPEHLDPVPLAENIRRAYAAGVGGAFVNLHKTHCKRGHEFTPENTKVVKGRYRQCIACNKMHFHNAYLRRKAHRRKASM